MHRELKNELRKKIQNYSYGLNDHLDLSKRSNIFKGVNETNQDKVAIKVVDLRLKETDPSIREQLPFEIEALKKLLHPNILHSHDIYSTVNNCYIITQFCQGGDIDNKINTRGALAQSQGLALFRGLLMAYMHIVHQKFIHGGLKLSALLLKDNQLKIGGFSNCRKSNRPDIKREVPYNPYQSPESLSEGIFNHKSDIWSMGVILYKLLHGNLPYPENRSDRSQADFVPPLNVQLGEEIKDFIKSTLVRHEARLSLEELFTHKLVKKLLNGYFTTDKYLLGALGHQPEGRSKRDHRSTKAEKHIACQINWMRFLFRLMDRISSVPEEASSTLVFKFIVLRQLAVQHENISKHLKQGENSFGFTHWQQFLQDRDRLYKFRQAFQKNQVRFEKAKNAYQKLLEKLLLRHSNPKGLCQLLNDNFVLSEYNSVFALSAVTTEIKRLWEKITKEFPVKGKYSGQTVFRFKGQLLLVDYATTYYQLNCLLVEDFQRVDYFQKMSKLQLILEYPPVELDASNIGDMESKLKQLALL